MWIEANPEPTGGRVAPAPVDVVAAAFKAFRQQDRDTLRTITHPEVEFRVINGLGLTQATNRGFDAVMEWWDRMDRSENWLQASPRAHEDMGGGWVLVTGTTSEQARGGGRFASSVAWLFRVRDGLIVSAIGYPSEAEARRALEDSTG